MKKRCLPLLSLVLAGSLLTACTSPAPAETSGSPAPSQSAAGIYTPGEYSATVDGFGGPVTVTITVDENAILSVSAVGDDETDGVGSRAIEELPAAIQEAGSVDVETISGATISSNAVLTAAKQALAQAKGESATLSMEDGTYEATGNGFDLTTPVPVTVEISGGKISAITVGECKETEGMLASVNDLLIPRIVEHQSLAVDAITGATSTSNAVKAAVLDCCIQAGADEAALYAEIPASTAEETYEVDVIVVGMGGSGTTAALSAAENGAKVLAMDKAGKWGGTSAITSGPAAVNAPSQVEAEIADWPDPITNETRTKAAGEELVDAEALYNEWTSYTTVDGQQHAKTDIIRLEIDLSGDTLDWLSGYGFQFDPARGFVGGKWGIFAPYSGGKTLTESFFSSAYDSFTEMGGQYLLETEATELIVEDGRVTGVKAVKADGTQVTAKADAVILATGGFGGSSELQEEYLGESWKLYGMAQNDGAGIRMAVEAGAATYNIDMPPMSHFVAPAQIITSFESSDNDIPYGMVCSGEVLAVDQTGVRQMSESGLAMNAYTMGSRYFTIFSKEQIDTLREQGFSADASGRYLSQGGVTADTPLSNIDAVLEEGITMGFIYKADSLEALAQAIGGDMSADNLKASVEAYGQAAAGEDPLGKDASLFQRLGAPSMDSEYYIAVTGAPYIYSTCGGLDVDVSMRVLDESGAPIEGLYAVGTDSMGVLFTNTKGYANYGGIAQAYAFVSGRVAGEAAAQAVAGN